MKKTEWTLSYKLQSQATVSMSRTKKAAEMGETYGEGGLNVHKAGMAHG